MTCYDKSLYYLGIREHSRRELEGKLKEKYSTDEIKEALDRLEEENYLSDVRFAEVYIRSRLRKSPEGKGILVQRLMLKGLLVTEARAAVESYFEEHSEEIERIYADYSSKIIASKGDLKGKAFLSRKGIRSRSVPDYD